MIDNQSISQYIKIEKSITKTIVKAHGLRHTRGFASYNIRNPNTIQNEIKECYHSGKLPQTSLRKDGDEVPLNWNPNGYKSHVAQLE